VLTASNAKIPETPPRVVDPLTELLRLVEREHQRINDLESEVRYLKQELAEERHIRRMLGARFDRMEIGG
jgi:hypothetical protein